MPAANADYWAAKIARNQARDASVDARLAALGWTAATVWECELKDRDALAERLRAALGPPVAAGRARG